MGFATELKTIMKLDDSDWKKALESVKKVEKEYFREAKANSEKLTDLDDKLANKKEANAKKLTGINRAIGKLDDQLLKAKISGDAKEQASINKKLKLIKAVKTFKTIAHKSTIKELTDEIARTKALDRAQTNSLKFVKIRKQNALDLQKQTQKSTTATNTNTKAKVANTTATQNLANQTIRYLRWAGTIAGVVYAANRAWSATLGIGIQVNKMMEDNTSGIAALLSANTQMILSNGTVVNSYEKFKIGQEVAAKTMEDLRKASIKTYATFPQLTEIFQQAIGQTLSMGTAFGGTTEEIINNTVKLSQSLSNIAGAIGMPMDRVREEIRSMLSGNASTDSLISTMLFGSPGEANKAIRDAKARGKDGLTDVLREMLVPFDALSDVDSYTRSLLQLEDAWSQAMAGMATPVFEDLKVTFKELAITLNENKDEIQNAFDTFYEGAKQVVGVIDNIAVPATAVAGVYALSTASTVLTTRVLALNVAMLANPLFLATATAIGIYTAIENWEALGDTLLDVADVIAEASDREFGTELGENVDANREKFEDFKDSIWDADEALREFGGTVEGATYKAFSLGFDEELLNKALEETKRAMLSVKKDIESAAVDGNKEILKSLRKEYQAMAISLSTMTADAKDRGGLQTLISTDSKLLEKRTKENNKDLAETIQLKKEILINDEEIGQLGKKYVVDVKNRAQTLQDINVFLENTKNINKEISKIELEALQEKMKKEFEAQDLALEISNVKKEIAGVEVDKLDTLQLEIDRTQALLLLTDQAGFTKDQRQKADLKYHEARLAFLKEENKEKAKEQELDFSFAEVEDPYGNILDSQLALANATQDWGIELDGVAGKFQDLSKSIMALSVQDLTSKKESWDLEQKYIKDSVKAQKGLDKELDKKGVTELQAIELIGAAEKKQSKLYENYLKSEEQLNFQATQNQIQGYSQVSGAMSQMFDEGSREAAAFQAIESGLAVVAGVRAILTQGTGDPYTAIPRMIAMAAMVATTLGQAKIAFKPDATTATTYDAFSQQEANTGIGSVLGDSEAQSDSIENSLSTLEDFAKPEFELMSEMSASLKSIEYALGGVSANILKSVGFGVGEGFTPFSTSREGDFATGTTANTAIAVLGGYGIQKTISDTVSKIPILNIFTSVTDWATDMIGKVFGGSTSATTGLTDAGLTFNAQLISTAVTDLVGSEYQTIKTTIVEDGGWFHSDKTTIKYKSYFEQLDTEITSQFELILGTMYNTMFISGEMLDVAASNIEENLSNFYVDLGKISLKGKTGEQIEEELTAIFGKTADEMTRAAFRADAFSFADYSEADWGFTEKVNTDIVAAYSGWWGEITKEQYDSNIAGTFWATWFAPIYEQVDQYNDGMDNYLATSAAAFDEWASVTDYETTLDGFQQIGEGFYETLTRVSVGMQEAEYYVDKLGYAFDNVAYTDIINQQGIVSVEALRQSITAYDEVVWGASNGVVDMISLIGSSADELYVAYTDLSKIRDQIVFIGQASEGLTASMLLGAGGIDSLTGAMESYFEDFLTEEQQVVFQTQEMTAEFEKLNLSLPESKEAFTSLLDGIDLTTDAGQELWGRTILLADGFAELTDVQEDFYDSALEGVLSLSETFDQLGESIDATIETLLGNQTGADTQDELIASYWEKRGELDSLLAKDGDLTTTEQQRLSTLIGDINSLSLGIQGATVGDTQTITEGLVGELEGLKTALDFDNQILNVRIVEFKDAFGIASAPEELGVLSALPSYDVGSSYIPYDQTANIHRGEMVIDSDFSSKLRRYGIQQPVNNVMSADVLSELKQISAKIGSLEKTSHLSYEIFSESQYKQRPLSVTVVGTVATETA